MNQALTTCNTVIQQNVAWGEMDAFNHVNNVAYFRYFESARIANMEKLGIMAYLQEHQVGPIMASTSCRYKAALTYPDTIHIGVKNLHIEADRYTQQYVIYSEKLDRIVTEGEGLIVFFDFAQNKKTKIPELIKQRLINTTQ